MERKKNDDAKKSAEKSKKEMEENDKKVKQIIEETEPELSVNPGTALKKLEETFKKYVKLSATVHDLLADAIQKAKNLNKQTNLFS